MALPPSGPAPTFSVMGPLGSLNSYIHILLPGQSMRREQWTACGTLWLNSRAVSMEEAVGCAATRFLPLRSWWLALPPLSGPGTVSGATTCSSQQWGLTQAVQVAQSCQSGLTILCRVSFGPGLFSLTCVTHCPPPPVYNYFISISAR